MSRVSIFQKSWTDIVFEGRNQAYGAYQLRNHDGRTTLTALLLGTACAAALISAFSLLQHRGLPVTAPLPDEQIIRVTRLEPILKTPQAPQAPAAQNPADSPSLYQAQPAPPADATPMDAPTGAAGTDTGGSAVSGNPLAGSTGTVGTGVEAAPAPTGNPAGQLDRLPAFPGGIEKFYEYVATHYDSDGLAGNRLNLVVSFVVETDGSLTDIRIVRSSGADADREALRVLRGMRKKWEPAIKNGQPVRTQYLLPISVVIRNSD